MWHRLAVGPEEAPSLSALLPTNVSVVFLSTVNISEVLVPLACLLLGLLPGFVRRRFFLLLRRRLQLGLIALSKECPPIDGQVHCEVITGTRRIYLVHAILVVVFADIVGNCERVHAGQVGQGGARIQHGYGSAFEDFDG